MVRTLLFTSVTWHNALYVAARYLLFACSRHLHIFAVPLSVYTAFWILPAGLTIWFIHRFAPRVPPTLACVGRGTRSVTLLRFCVFFVVRGFVGSWFAPGLRVDSTRTVCGLLPARCVAVLLDISRVLPTAFTAHSTIYRAFCYRSCGSYTCLSAHFASVYLAGLYCRLALCGSYTPAHILVLVHSSTRYCTLAMTSSSLHYEHSGSRFAHRRCLRFCLRITTFVPPAIRIRRALLVAQPSFAGRLVATLYGLTRLLSPVASVTFYTPTRVWFVTAVLARAWFLYRDPLLCTRMVGFLVIALHFFPDARFSCLHIRIYRVAGLPFCSYRCGSLFRLLDRYIFFCHTTPRITFVLPPQSCTGRMFRLDTRLFDYRGFWFACSFPPHHHTAQVSRLHRLPTAFCYVARACDAFWLCHRMPSGFYHGCWLPSRLYGRFIAVRFTLAPRVYTRRLLRSAV